MQDKSILKVGDIFTVGNKDKPPWLKGKWIVVSKHPKKYEVKKLLDKRD